MAILIIFLAWFLYTSSSPSSAFSGGPQGTCLKFLLPISPYKMVCNAPWHCNGHQSLWCHQWWPAPSPPLGSSNHLQDARSSEKGRWGHAWQWGRAARVEASWPVGRRKPRGDAKRRVWGAVRSGGATAAGQRPTQPSRLSPTQPGTILLLYKPWIRRPYSHFWVKQDHSVCSLMIVCRSGQ